MTKREKIYPNVQVITDDWTRNCAGMSVVRMAAIALKGTVSVRIVTLVRIVQDLVSQTHF